MWRNLCFLASLAMVASCLDGSTGHPDAEQLDKSGQRGIDMTEVCTRLTSTEDLSDDEADAAMDRMTICAGLESSLEAVTGLKLTVTHNSDGSYFMTYDQDPCTVNCNVGSSEQAREYLMRLLNGIYIKGTPCGRMWPLDVTCNQTIQVSYHKEESAAFANGLGLFMSPGQVYLIAQILEHGESYNAQRDGAKFKLLGPTSISQPQRERLFSLGMVFLHETMHLPVGQNALGLTQRWHTDGNSEWDQILRATGVFQCEAEAGYLMLRHKADYRAEDIFTNPGGNAGKRVLLLERCDDGQPIAVMYDADTFNVTWG